MEQKKQFIKDLEKDHGFRVEIQRILGIEELEDKINILTDKK